VIRAEKQIMEPRDWGYTWAGPWFQGLLASSCLKFSIEGCTKEWASALASLSLRLAEYIGSESQSQELVPLWIAYPGSLQGSSFLRCCTGAILGIHSNSQSHDANRSRDTGSPVENVPQPHTTIGQFGIRIFVFSLKLCFSDA
jgi:hypothetical protein